jgi:ABC-type lipoprotein release transport system permease subunit
MLLGVSFSSAVILCNIGLMNGYQLILKEGLKKSVSDVEIFSSFGFFNFEDKVLRKIEDHPDVKTYAGVIQTQGFLAYNGNGRGVMVKGIDANEYKNINNFKYQLNNNEIVIGIELAKKLKIKINDEVTMAFPRGNLNHQSLPQIIPMKVVGITSSGIYQKDLRIVYAHRSYIKTFVNAKSEINLLNIKLVESSGNSIEKIEKVVSDFNRTLDFGYKARPFWHEFSSLLKAVKIEKFSITVILQLIIIISLFNVIAFLIFVLEKKKQEIFLLRALGLTQKMISSFWKKFLIITWLISCILCALMTHFFDSVLLKLPFLKIPGKIYQLQSLSLSLDTSDYLIVFSLVLLWIMLVLLYSLRRIRKKTLLQGLREEFA